MNLYNSPSFNIAAITLITGLFFLSSDPKLRINRIIFYIDLAVAFWLVAKAVSLTNLVLVGLLWTSATLYHFSIHHCDVYLQQRNILKLVYLQAALFSFAVLYLFPGEILVLIFLGECVLVSLLNFFYAYSQVKDSAARREYRFFIMVFLILPFIKLQSNLSAIFLVLIFIFYRFRLEAVLTSRKIQQLEKEIKEKSIEVANVVEELRSTQVKLMETGKVSALASLSAGILHQISQPITAIHGFVRFIKKEMNPKETFYRPITLIEEQSVYLKKMLEDLLDLIRHREIKKENVNVNEVLKRATNLLADELRIRRVNWDCHLAENLPLLFADGIHLQQIFMNIMINSMQALSQMPRGEYRYIKISTEYSSGENTVKVIFRDNGPGISPEDQAKVFEPFFSTKTTGTGIGLALCKDLIAEHGGKITVENEDQGGAKFTVHFPVKV